MFSHPSGIERYRLKESEELIVSLRIYESLSHVFLESYLTSGQLRSYSDNNFYSSHALHLTFKTSGRLELFPCVGESTSYSFSISSIYSKTGTKTGAHLRLFLVQEFYVSDSIS